MTAFLSPPPERIDAMYDIPRTRNASGRGPSEYVFAGQFEWLGSMRFTKTDSRDTRTNPILGLARADRLDAGFFIDIPHPKLALPETEVPPTWHQAGNGSNIYHVTLNSGHGAQAGDYISVRVNGAEAYVTCRIIDAIETNIDGNDVAVPTQPIPHEFFPVLQVGGNLEYCLDRPHVRAVFDESPVAIQRANTFISTIPTIKWREDTLGNVNGLRDISGLSPALENVIITNRGEPILTNTGEYIQVNG